MEELTFAKSSKREQTVVDGSLENQNCWKERICTKEDSLRTWWFRVWKLVETQFRGGHMKVEINEMVQKFTKIYISKGLGFPNCNMDSPRALEFILQFLFTFRNKQERDELCEEVSPCFQTLYFYSIWFQYNFAKIPIINFLVYFS